MPHFKDELRLRKVENTEGKTIAKVHLNSWGGKLLFRFTDGTFIAFLAEGGDCDEEPSISLDRYVYKYDLRGVGVITDEEYKEIYEAEKREQQEERRKRYEELKKEFEGGQNV
jgi:hypothetical protein